MRTFFEILEQVVKTVLTKSLNKCHECINNIVVLMFSEHF